MERLKIRTTAIESNTTNEDFLLERSRATLEKYFGYDTFREGQWEVIRRLLNHKSTLAVFPTGGGKSLCYQLPAILFSNLTIVVSPLLALIREQVDYLNSIGVNAVRIDSTQDASEHQVAVSQLRSGKARILYVAPERLFNERFRELIQSLKIDLLAIDEAHCISQWGHNFRPDYLRLREVVRQYNIPTVLTLTATATQQVAKDIRTTFEICEANEIRTSSYRPNLHLRFLDANHLSKDRLLLSVLDKHERPAIVYTTLQATSETVAELLQSKGFNARAYHAGMSDEDRRSTQDLFMQSDDLIVVATIAFGMGIDKSNIRTIIHYNLSNGVENYAQEIGRAGRDNLTSHCITLVDTQDRTTLENFAHGDLPDYESLRGLIQLLSNQPEQFFLSYYQTAMEFDIRETVLKTIFTYLELDGYLEAIGPRYDSYRFKPIKPLYWIVEQFNDDRRKFADSVLSLSVKKKVWTEINMAVASQRLNEPRTRIAAMLEYFAEKGWIELQPAGLMFGYRFRQRFANVAETAERVFSSLQSLESRSIERIDQLLDIAYATDCQPSALARHFGDELPSRCGHCSACLGNFIPPESRERSAGQLGTSIKSMLKSIQEKYPQELGSFRQASKFLCGISSPLMVRKRLTREPGFGSCQHIPFETVLAKLESLES